MSILIKDSLNNVIFSDPNAPSGRFAASGVGVSGVSYKYQTVGTMLFRGVTPTHGGGAVGITGSAPTLPGFAVKAAGRVNFTGLAAMRGGYIFRADDGPAVTGRASVLQVNNVIGVGNIKFRGNAGVSLLPTYDGNVRATLSGRSGGTVDVFVIPNYEGDVYARVRGFAGIDFIPALEGGVRARFIGEAEVTFIPSYEGRIKGFIKGKAETSFLGNYEATGRLRALGSAFTSSEPDFDHEPAGGFGVTSDPANPISSTYEYEPSDGPALAGRGRVFGTIRGLFATDGPSLSGTNGNVVLGFAPPTSGGVGLGGQAGLSSSTYEYYPDAGIAAFTGLAGTTQGYSVEAGGGLLVGSATGSVSGAATVDGSASFGIRGTASVGIRDAFQKKFAWRIHEKVSFEKTFAWGVGERPFSFYRVSGKCKPARCPPLQVNGCSPDSTYTYIVNVYARNLAEVCRKLRDRNMIFPIATIEKFSTPASRIDYTDDTDTTCNKLVDVTPPITFLPCQDLLVDLNTTVNIGVGMTSVLVVAQYEAGGSLGVKGGVYPFDYRIYEPFGIMGVSGAATCVQKNYKYEAFGSIGFGGTVEKITLPVWTYNGRGALSAALDAEPVRIVHPFWFMEGGGVLGVVGEWEAVPAMEWEMSGEISKGDSTAFGDEDFLPYIVDMTGGLGVSNDTDGSRGEYVHEAVGAVGFSGLTHFLTPHITIQPSGRLRMSNGDGSVPATSSNLGIVAGFGGSATVAFTPEYGQAGRIRLGGEAAVNCSVIEPNGRARIRGTALVNCSDLGEIAMPFAAEFLAKNETVLFAYQDAPAAVRPAKRITSRCCSQSLPLRLWVQHPLAGANHFNHFLQRNNLLIDNPMQVYYNQTEKAWYNTIHFEGFAPDFPTIESWTITFGWSCSDLTSPSLALSDTDLYYRFSMMATLRSVNNPTIPHRVSKLVVGFDPTRVCFNNKTLSFPFIFDTAAKTTSPSSVQSLVYVDDIGLFKTAGFLKSPQIRFKVSEIIADIPQAVVDIGPAVTGSQRVGSSFNGVIVSSLPG